MQKVINVNLAPYKDFKDLMLRGTPDLSMVDKLRGKMNALDHRKELKQAIYGENADLGEDDVMKSNDEGAVFARKMVKDLSKYVKFSEEDQKKLDNLKD
ncbi:hypothetical protein [Mucilaginibacter sp. 22184]|uniref:hypothetical protein n=1 Tax=Mucilaginibacter sp. 22184 TaxID=3453887 RepID=UPI003F83F21D